MSIKDKLNEVKSYVPITLLALAHPIPFTAIKNYVTQEKPAVQYEVKERPRFFYRGN